MGEPSSVESLRLSRFASVVDIGERYVVANVATLDRLIVAPALGLAIKRLGEQAQSPQEFTDRCPHDVDAQRLIELLRTRGIVTSAAADETTAAELSREPPATASTRRSAVERVLAYRSPQLVRADDLARASPLREVRALMIGGCVLAFERDVLVREGLRRGLDIRCRHLWPTPSARLRPLIDDWRPDLVVLQPTVQPLLAGLWDEGALVAADRRERRLASLARLLDRMIEELAEALGEAVGMVHNFAPPAISPFGRCEFRQPVNFRRIVHELNATVDAVASRHPNVMVVDVERLATRHGAGNVFDDLVFPFAHHGGAVDPARPEPHQLPILSELLADEHLALLELHRRTSTVRCIAVDLDGTLWPGVLAEDGFEWFDEDGTPRWMHLGLHQALRILASRGILLATLSKGTAATTLAAWRQGGDRPGLLSPDDFVLHGIDWGPKPQTLAGICERLSLQPGHVLFLDDNPVERKEMRAAMPAVRVYDADVAQLRALLLRDPSCDAGSGTAEARARTRTTIAALAREAAGRDMPRAQFLSSLGITLTVGWVQPEHVARIHELQARTTQFNTTGRCWSPAALEALAARESSAVLWARVADEFADYGLCGAVVIEGASILSMVLSCRVIGLEVDLAILGAALRGAERLVPGTVGWIRPTERNAPAQDLFARAGLAACPGSARRYEIVDPESVEARCTVGHVALEWHPSAGAVTA